MYLKRYFLFFHWTYQLTLILRSFWTEVENTLFQNDVSSIRSKNRSAGLRDYGHYEDCDAVVREALLAYRLHLGRFMPRRLHQVSSDYPYHVSARCKDKEPYGVELEFVWEVMSDYLHFLHYGFNCRIHAFVLMNNHFHLLISTPDANLSAAMAYFMCKTSLVLNYKKRSINQLWGSRYFRCLVGRNQYWDHVYKYIYRNPVRAGLVRHIEDYDYSTAKRLLGGCKLSFPVIDNHGLLDRTESVLSWLNEVPEEKAEADIKRALKKRVFKLSREKGKENRLEYDAL